MRPKITYTERLTVPSLKNTVMCVRARVHEKACVEVYTEGEFRLQMLHCAVSNGQSHFSTYRSLQLAVPEEERDIMSSVFKYK